MTPLISEVKKITQNLRCSQHNQAAEIIASGDNIEFKCCCESFRSKVTAVSKKTAEEYASKAMKDMLRNAFKGSKNIKIR